MTISFALIWIWQLKCLEATLKGALRREKFAETEVKRLEAEVAHMNRLVCIIMKNDNTFILCLVFTDSFTVVVHSGSTKRRRCTAYKDDIKGL